MTNVWTQKDRNDFILLASDVKDLVDEGQKTRKKLGNVFERLGAIEKRIETRFAADDQRRKTTAWIFKTLGTIATISTGAGMLAVMLLE